jgi:hypothetical protein
MLTDRRTHLPLRARCGWTALRREDAGELAAAQDSGAQAGHPRTMAAGIARVTGGLLLIIATQ